MDERKLAKCQTEYKIIGRLRRIIQSCSRMNVDLHNSEIKRAAKMKSLRIIVDEGINWDTHFNNVKNKTIGGLRIIKIAEKYNSTIPT